MNDLLSSLHLLRPHGLWLLLPIAALLWWLARRRDTGGNWHSVVAPELLPYLIENTATQRRRSPLPLLALAAVSAVIAIAGPSWQKLPQPVLQKQDALVLVLDLSYSMWAEDTRPSRIDRARRKLLDLLDMRREGQTALVAFAGDAHVVTPLTDDHPTIANLLPALDPGMMPLPGSDPAAAVASADKLLDSAGVLSGRILLVTDGLDDNDADAIRKTLADSGARLSVLGVGTPEGAPIPLPDGGFIKDDDGTIVMPKLPARNLRKLATSTGGKYRKMTVDPSDLEALLAPDAGMLDTETREIDRRADTWADMGHWFALPLLPLLLLAFRRGALYTLIPLLAVLPLEKARADGWQDLWLTPDQQGAQALEAGEAETAAEQFDDPRWRATAAYASGDYGSAVEGFKTDDTADGWYNRGNALAREGELDAALDAYRESLAREPGREDAQNNLELVEQLKRQQDEQQQKQQQKQQQQQQNQQQQNEGGGGEPQENGDGNSEDTGTDDSSPSGEQQPGDKPGEDPDRDDSGDSEKPSPESSATSDNETQGEGGQANAAESREQPQAAIDTASSLAESLERDQAMQQWLRRVPDDPAGLLREKFRYESRKRQRQGNEGKADEDVW